MHSLRFLFKFRANLQARRYRSSHSAVFVFIVAKAFDLIYLMICGCKDLLTNCFFEQVRSASAVGNTITVTLTSCGPVYNPGSCSYLRSACLLACRHSKPVEIQVQFCLFPAIVCHSSTLSLSSESSVQEYAANGTVELEGIASTLIPQHFANVNFSFWLQVKCHT